MLYARSITNRGLSNSPSSMQIHTTKEEGLASMPSITKPVVNGSATSILTA